MKNETGNTLDRFVVAWNAGCRDIVLAIEKDIVSDPYPYVRLTSAESRHLAARLNNIADRADQEVSERNNLQACRPVKEMTAAEAAGALKTLAAKIAGPVSVGVWEGTLTGKMSGEPHAWKHIAVFGDDELIAVFGPHGDAASEAAAVLCAVAFTHANVLAAALA